MSLIGMSFCSQLALVQTISILVIQAETLTGQQKRTGYVLCFAAQCGLPDDVCICADPQDMCFDMFL